ncbi:MAG: DUF1616 domain-containing protein [Candidatus Aenigmarchaeota archaeon]|nr:DUF1616 domain-containing protein [Candidatus Aenigmarchaeota archaeon]
MDNDDNILNAIIIACVIGIAIVLFLIVTTDRDESFTELYFLNYTKVPVGDALFITYGINNHENKDMVYDVVVLVGNESVIREDVAVLKDGAHKGEYNITVESADVQKITLKLNGREEEIHFWTKQ